MQEFREKFRRESFYHGIEKAAKIRTQGVQNGFRGLASYSRRWREEGGVSLLSTESFINWEEPERSLHIRRQKRGREAKVVDPDLFLRLAVLCSGPSAKRVYHCYTKVSTTLFISASRTFFCSYTQTSISFDFYCLKMTQNVAFEFLNFGIFHQFLSYLN